MREQFLQLPGTSVHKRSPLAELVATYPGPHPTTDDPASQAAYAEQVLAWLRHDHPDEWRDYLAHVARHLQQEGYHRGPAHKAGTGEISPPGRAPSRSIGPIDPQEAA